MFMAERRFKATNLENPYQLFQRRGISPVPLHCLVKALVN